MTATRDLLGTAMVFAVLTPIQAAVPLVKTAARDGLNYVWIAPGKFAMGCSVGDPECFKWEMPTHQVAIDRGFWIGQTEVTQRAYRRVTGTNPSLYRGPLRPVDRVSWHNAQSYCAAIGMRLPTEAEWEYAARGGAIGSRNGSIGSIAWYDGNASDVTHQVRAKQPNGFGLYDMLGNVWEWVADSYQVNRNMKILRGASFFNPARDVRVSNRLWALPETAHRDMGFRCAGE